MTRTLVDELMAADHADPAATLAVFRRAVHGRIVFTTSFGLEDQIVTHLVLSQSLDIEIATLDTGRLFPETYDVWERTERRYGVRIRALHPDADDLERLINRQGINGFRATVAARKACCAVRKVAPLERLLAGASGWITGLRADQSIARTAVGVLDWDADRGLPKLNPLAAWTREDAARFAAAHDLPVNVLHARGFPSIGCQPCTRAVAPEEHERAGRWWWENEAGDTAAKECGLHVGADGRLTRQGTTASAP